MPPWIDLRPPQVNPLGNLLSLYSSANWINLGARGVLVDYTSLGVGTPLAAGTLPGGGTYTQAAGANQAEETVQTSASTVARWAFVANLPRIGLLADGGIGLVLEPPRTQRVHRSNPTMADWITGGGTPSVSSVTGPDGTASAAQQMVDASAVAFDFRQLNVTTNFAASAPVTASAWARLVSGALPATQWPGSSIALQSITGAVSTWRKAQWTGTATASVSWSLNQLIGTVVGDTGTSEFWGYQYEDGKYATNLVPQNAAAGSTCARAGYRVQRPLSQFVRGGAFKAVLTTVPHGAATEYDGDSATVRLWTIDANTYAEVNTTTRVLTVSVNGVARVAGVPLWWLRGHRVQWSWEVGGGSLRVRYRYSTDQGATWTLPFDPFGGTVYSDSAISTASSTVDLYSDSGSSKWWGTGVVSEEAILTAPAWALQWLPTDDASVKAHLRGDGHYTLSAGLVSAWTSQTAAAVSVAQGTGANQPTLVASGVGSQPALNFDGSNDFMTWSGLSFAAADILVVGALRPLAKTASDATLFDSTTGRFLCVSDSVNTTPAGSVGWYDGAYKSAGVGLTMATAQIVSWDLRSGANGRIFVNGAQLGSTTTYTQKAVGGVTNLGADISGINPYVGRIGDFIIATAPTDALRRNIEAYLSTKYGIAVS